MQPPTGPQHPDYPPPPSYSHPLYPPAMPPRPGGRASGGLTTQSKVALGIGAGLVGLLIVCVVCSLALGRTVAPAATTGGSAFVAPTITPVGTDTPALPPTPTLTAPQVNATATATFCGYWTDPPPGCPGAPASGSNPWGYNFTSGNLIYSPPSDFCSYFACISNFWNGGGYVVECTDSKYSKSGGLEGVCSTHGGYWRTLYSH